MNSLYPKVTVLMSVYNGETFLKQAIDSILLQSFKDFEFLIINDGSTDNTVSIINSYTDSRIRLINNQENLGLTKSLNKGLKLAKGQYIARMDADDISMPDRLLKQVKFMDDHLDIGLCSSWTIEQYYGREKPLKTSVNHKEIVADLLFKGNILGHAPVMFRKEIVYSYNLFYNEKLSTCQDYELWVRFMSKTNIAVVPEYLLRYRIHDGSISHTKLEEQSKLISKIQAGLLRTLLDEKVSSNKTVLDFLSAKLNLKYNEYPDLKNNMTLVYNKFLEISTVSCVKKRMAELLLRNIFYSRRLSWKMFFTLLNDVRFWALNSKQILLMMLHLIIFDRPLKYYLTKGRKYSTSL